MVVDVVMPKMGESIQEGTILQWLKNVGDAIERDEILLEISTDKVDTEVPSPTEGVLTEVLVAVDDVVEVGTVIARIETDASAAAATPAPAQAQAEAAPAPAAPAPQPAAAPAPAAVEAPAATPAPAAASGPATDVVMPKMGESIQEGTILQWLKQPGDAVERDEILLEISTDKVDTEVPSPVSGTLLETLAAEGDVVEVGNIIARIGSGDAAPAAAPAPAAPAPAANASADLAAAPAASNGQPPIPVPGLAGATDVPRLSGNRFYSPLVRSIAKEEGISVQELDALTGTGLEGRVTKKDVMAYLANRGSAPVAAAPAPAAPAAAPAPAKAAAPAPAKKAAPAEDLDEEAIYRKHGRNIEIVRMDRVRQKIAEHMVMSKSTSPHVTSVAEADVTEIVRLREKSKADFLAKEGIKLTYTPFICRAIVEGVRKFPGINVSVEGKNIIQHKKTNLSFAAALPDGNLIVPVIKDAETLNITGLARSVNDLATRARSKNLKPDETFGGTVTFTNVGSFGTLFGSPVINQPQTAIISAGAFQKRPVVKEVEGNDMILVRTMVYVSITYDHRVIDGALAGQALKAIVDSLENMNANTVQF